MNLERHLILGHVAAIINRELHTRIFTVKPVPSGRTFFFAQKHTDTYKNLLPCALGLFTQRRRTKHKLTISRTDTQSALIQWLGSGGGCDHQHHKPPSKVLSWPMMSTMMMMMTMAPLWRLSLFVVSTYLSEGEQFGLFFWRLLVGRRLATTSQKFPHIHSVCRLAVVSVWMLVWWNGWCGWFSRFMEKTKRKCGTL